MICHRQKKQNHPSLLLLASNQKKYQNWGLIQRVMQVNFVGYTTAPAIERPVE